MTATAREEQAAGSRSDLTGAIWIEWGNHLRTNTLTERLGIPLVRVSAEGGRLGRYIRSARLTNEAIRTHRPRVIFATNPSIVLGFVLLLLKLRYRFTLVSDAHYVGVQAMTQWPFVQSLLNLQNRLAKLVIVTNPGHAEFLRRVGARPYVCPDPLPRLAPTISPIERDGKSAFLICSYDVDEPYMEVFEAFRELEKEGFTLYVSGNYRKAGIDPEQFPGVQFLGFVDDDAYLAQLRAADIIMDLTTMENCLVCGAYEAIVEGKPLILSGSEASRSYFGDACHFTANDPPAIAASVRTAYEQRDALSAAARQWAEKNERDMDECLARLVDEVEALSK